MHSSRPPSVRPLNAPSITQAPSLRRPTSTSACPRDVTSRLAPAAELAAASTRRLMPASAETMRGELGDARRRRRPRPLVEVWALEQVETGGHAALPRGLVGHAVGEELGDRRHLVHVRHELGECTGLGGDGGQVGEVDLHDVDDRQQPVERRTRRPPVDGDPEATLRQRDDARDDLVVDLEVTQDLQDDVLGVEGHLLRGGEERARGVDVQLAPRAEHVRRELPERRGDHAGRGGVAVLLVRSVGGVEQQLVADHAAAAVHHRLAADAGPPRRRCDDAHRSLPSWRGRGRAPASTRAPPAHRQVSRQDEASAVDSWVARHPGGDASGDRRP